IRSGTFREKLPRTEQAVGIRGCTARPGKVSFSVWPLAFLRTQKRRSVGLFCDDCLSEVADILKAIELLRAKLDPIFLFDRDQNFDLFERVPTRHIIRRESRLQDEVLSQEDITKNIVQRRIDIGL